MYKRQVLTIEGILASPGKSMADLETDYVLPLKDMVHKEVAISAPNSKYDGNWIFANFTVEERKGIVNALFYKMEFYKAGQHTVF